MIIINSITSTLQLCQMQGLLQSGDYGFEVPIEILDHSWRKCLQQQPQNLEYIKSGLKNIRSFLSQQAQPNNMIEIVFQSQIHKLIMKYSKRLFRRLNYNNTNCKIDLQIFHQILWIYTNLACGDSHYSNQLVNIGVSQLSIQVFTLPQLPEISQIFCINFQLISNIAGQYNAKVKLSYLTDPTFQYFLTSRYLNYINCDSFHQLASIALYSMLRDFSKCVDKSSNFMQSLKQVLSQFYFPFIKNVLIKVQPEAGNGQALCHLLFIYFDLTKDQFDCNQQAKCVAENYLNHPNQKIRNLCIKIYGNMVANSDQGVDYALQNSLFINLLIHSLKNTNDAKLQKQCAWILSNILAGTPNQIDYFIQYNPTIFNDIYQVLNQDLDDHVIKQMCWSIANLYSTCSEKTFQTVYESSIVEQISNLVQKCHLDIVKQVYVEGIQNYLNKLTSSSTLKTNIFAQNSFFIVNCLNFIIQNSNTQKATNKALQLSARIDTLLKNCSNSGILSNQSLEQNLSNLEI